MDPVCHRCGNPLHEGEGFCSHCGAPQLLVDTSEPSEPQQPTQQRLRGDPHRVQWHTAITSALLIAVPVGLLSALAGMSSLFVIAGGFATIALYQRRSESFTDMRIGWRLGAILGVAAALIASATDAVRMLVERYPLHHAQALDEQFQTVARQMADQALHSNSEAMHQAPQLVHMWAGFWLSPDGHAAIQLMTAGIVSVGMVLFAATGGAIAGRVLTARPRPQQTL